MASSLTFTSAAFAQNTTFAISQTTETTILSADATNTRRIYGMVFTNGVAAAPACIIRIKDGSNSPAAIYSVPAVSGVNVQTDIFGSSFGASVFQKKRDANGNPYYDIPAEYTITAQLATNTAATYMHVFGETYA